MWRKSSSRLFIGVAVSRKSFLATAWTFDQLDTTRGSGMDPCHRFARRPTVAEVVGFVDDDGIGQFLDSLEAVEEIAAPAEIGVVEHNEAAEVAGPNPSDVREVFLQSAFPDVVRGPSLGRTAPRACPRA